MWKLKLFLAVIFLGAFVALGIVVNADNAEMVNPSVLGCELPKRSLGFWLCAAVLVGGLLGFFVSWTASLTRRGQHHRLARKLKNCEQELAQLRTSALRE